MRNAATATPSSKVVVDEDEVDGVDALIDLAIDSSCDALCGVARVENGPLRLGAMFFAIIICQESDRIGRLAFGGKYKVLPLLQTCQKTISINNFLIRNEKISKFCI
jgi:hypothetical protein